MAITLDGTTGVTAAEFDGALDASNLTGALPAIDGSALTGITPTTAQVLTATAGASAGAVGTYVMARHLTLNVTNVLGSTTAGSNLYPANTFANNTDSGYDNRSGALSGTWKCMGETNVWNGTSVGTNAAIMTTLWLRIS